MINNNGQMPPDVDPGVGVQQTPETMGQNGGILGGVTGMFDNIKTPVFWFAIGFGVSWFMARGTRKKASLLKI